MRLSRNEAPLTPAAARDLEALDRALAGGPVAAEHADLAALVAAMRSDAPRIEPAFAAELDARVAGGFAGAGSRARLRALATSWSTRRHASFAIGSALSAAVAAAVVIVAVGGGGQSQHVGTPPHVLAPARGSASGGGASGAGATSEAPAASRPAAPSAAATAIGQPPPVPPGGSQSVGGPRDVQHDASLTLAAPRGQVQQVADRVVATTDRFGGIVESSNVNVGDQGGSQADFQLQVPAAKLEAALAAYSSLAHVSARNESAQDITDQTRAAGDRLTEARAERLALLRQLARATTPNQVASIHAQLGLVAGRIKQDEQNLQSLRQRVQFASVELTVTESQSSAGAGSGGWGPSDALGSALDVLKATVGVLVVVAVSLVPLGLLVAPAWGIAVALRRRRREQALGSLL